MIRTQYALFNVAPEGAVITENIRWLYDGPFSSYSFDRSEIEGKKEEFEARRKYILSSSENTIVPGTTMEIRSRTVTYGEWGNA